VAGGMVNRALEATDLRDQLTFIDTVTEADTQVASLPDSASPLSHAGPKPSAAKKGGGPWS
jgi:hypothetical protein